jgi:hypothetical protein
LLTASPLQNPSITSDCGNYVTGKAYCVEAPVDSGTSPTTAPITTNGPGPTTTTSAGNGVTTPTPTQDGMVDGCNKFHFVEAKQNCDTIAKTYGITRAQFISYNPSVGDTCAGMWAEVYVCVSVVGSEPSSTKTQSPTTTGNGNGVSTPSPTQPEMITDCNKFYFVKSKDTCASIAKANNLSQTQFFNWQPSVGTDCAGLWLDAYVCVGRIGVTPTPTAVPTSTKPGNGVATPTPIQDGMVSNCNRFQFVSSTTTCQSILDQYRITLAQFTKWNPGAGSGCNTLWGNTYACVGVIS